MVARCSASVQHNVQGCHACHRTLQLKHVWLCRMAGLQHEVALAKQALLAASGQLPPPVPKQGHSTSFWLATGAVALLACAGDA